MSAQGTTDADGAPTAPGSYSMRDLLAAGPAANAISTPPDGEAESSEDVDAGADGDERDAA
ncbi:hypothetical protein [Actinacidiphila soli]|uniref:hypothetical protein n=1 Tax=Actinacidiphila soli TaxID=2487275 RepID=UPI000FC9FED1|nr:hypothetical protein [Actinacidiphila soli]